MDSGFVILAGIMSAIGIAGIIGASTTHPIMYANPVLIFAFLVISLFKSSEKEKGNSRPETTPTLQANQTPVYELLRPLA